MEPFKNQFSAENARIIAERLRAVHPGFQMAAFRRGLEAELDPLELKDRMKKVADRIEQCLPMEVPELFRVLVAALANHEDDRTGLSGFQVWPLTEIVARRGLAHFKASMEALHEMTRRFTAEFAIRPFLREMPDRTLAQLSKWCTDPDEHVRRLVSEGSRPLLPWGGNLPALMEPPFPTLKLLERLYLDPSDYVRLSVSNHLNDLSKRHPGVVVGLLQQWGDRHPNHPQLEKLAKHACRTMLKNGHERAMELLGFGKAGAVTIERMHLPQPKIRLGEALAYELTLCNHSRKAVKVMFDYAIHHVKANGALSPKVFKGRTRILAAGERWEITGRHPIRKITTRVYHAGSHAFEPRINGAPSPPTPFELEL